MITISNMEMINDGLLTYLSYKDGNYEICVEPCLNGFDVAIYLNQELLQEKKCIDYDNEGDWMAKVNSQIQLLYSLYIKK